MQALEARSSRPKRRLTPRWIVVGIVIAAVAVGIPVYAVAGQRTVSLACAKRVVCQGGSPATASEISSAHFSVASTSPGTGASSVVSNTAVSVTFSSALKSGTPTPTLSPTVSGTWHQARSDELAFTPDAPFLPFTRYTLTIPAGPHGIEGTNGARLSTTKTISFTIANGSIDRLQELLAELDYLPLSYGATYAAPQDMALPQSGLLSWRWSDLPSALTGQWTQGATNAITKGAVMMFETENGLTVDGIAGPVVWGALLADIASNKVNTEPLSYVLVTKSLPEHLTVWVNGTLTLQDILVNTGVKGATTTDGTYEVFEHIRESHMSGTDITGTIYTITTVPWVSYFNGGEALHGYVRAAYGFPQSNGCVEMRPTTAGKVWPYTPIGTLVTVVGPSATAA